MFEDKRRGNKTGIIIFILMLFVAFSIGYYISLGIDNETNSFSKTNENLKVPDSLINVENPGSIAVEPIANETEIIEEEAFKLHENYKVRYMTYFTICGHINENMVDLPASASGLTEEEFMKSNPGWILSEINEDMVTLTREIETHCPKHYIIGIEGEYIAIYKYDENGEKRIIEKTDININTLMPEDQNILQSGIIADTEDDMEQKLEGFSN